MTIDWHSYGGALDRVFNSSKTRFARIIKFSHNIQNTGRQKRLFTEQLSSCRTASDRYPCCHIHEETTMHIFQCKTPGITELLHQGLGDLEGILQQRQDPCGMWCAIKCGINKYCTPGSYQLPELSDEIKKQSKIRNAYDGTNFLKGGWPNGGVTSSMITTC